MTLKEFLNFIADHFWGFILVLLIVGSALTQIAKYIFKRK